MALNLYQTKTYCNPLSIPEIPRGVEPWMEFTQEPKTDYRSISDPTVFYHDNKWYLYPSYGIAYVSEDFAHWKHVECTPYEAPGYSPSVVEHEGRFYMAVHSRPLFVADTPVGPFECLGRFIYPDGREFCPTDPGIFKDDDGRIYMYWCAGRPDPERNERVYQTVGAELDRKDLRRLLNTPVVINEFDPSHRWECFGQYNQDEVFGWIEGQHMLKHNGRYYLIYAGCGTQFAAYAMGVYYSDEGPLSGFVYQKNNPLTTHRTGIVKGAGHGCVEHGPNGTLWAFYTMTVARTHCFERRIGMDYVAVNEDGELYCPRVTDTPQYAPGAVADPLTQGDTGLFPLTYYNRSAYRSTSHTEGRDALYAFDESMLTWWQPTDEDDKKQILARLGAPYCVEASRIIWQEVGLDYDNGIVPGPIRYKIEACADEKGEEWQTVLDRTQNDEETVVDYRTFPPFNAMMVRLTITGAPKGIHPGVVDFAVFGRRVRRV